MASLSMSQQVQALQARVAALEQENRSLRLDLETCQRSQASLSRVEELERAYAMLQAQLRERDRCEQELHEQVAIAREQEKAAQERAAELAQANEALRNAITGLAQLDNLDHFLAQMLRVVLEISGAQGGTVVLIDGDVLRLPVLFTKQGLVDPQVQEHYGYSCIPFSPELREYAQRILKAKDFWLVGPDDPVHPPNFRTFHQEEGNRAISHIPMQVNNRLLGWLGLGFAEENPPLGRSYALLSVLAEQMTMALEMLRLAEEAKQAAIAREQERAAQERAAELAKANAALRGTTDRLANEPSLNAFLGHVLSEACRQLDCDAGAIFLYDETAEQLSLTVGVGIEDFPYSSQILLSTAKYPGWSVIKQTRKPLFVHPDVNPEMYAEGTLEWHRAQGHQGILVTAMMLGDRPLGQLAVAFRHKHNFKGTDLELFQALAQQATLAVQLMQLAEEAKQAAIAREQEKAAQERAAELEKANEALARTAVRLAEQGDLTRFFDELLLETSRQLEADSAHLVVYDQKQRRYNTLHQHNGNVKPEPELPASFSLDEMQPENFHTIAQRERRPHWYDPQADAHLFSPGAGVFLSRAGLRSVLHVPLVVGEQIVGGIGFAFRKQHPEVAQRQALVETLAHQAALAIQLIQLAEEAQQAAIAREQERAAQERAAELAKANEALKRSLNSLATDQSLESFLGNVLLSLAEQFESTTAEYWTHRDNRTAYIEMMAWEKSVYGKNEIAQLQPDHPGVTGYEVPSEEIFGEPLNRRTKHFVSEDLSNYTIAGDVALWLYQRGFHKQINIPLNVGEVTIGALVVRMHQGFEITTEKIELAWALANQVALALELTRLAEEAKQAAIAREQEKAAQERSAELAKVNEALRRSATGLATITNIDDILTVFLREAIAASGASAGAVLRRVGGTEFEFVAMLQGDELLRGEPLQNHPFSIAVREWTRHDRTGYFTKVANGQTMWWKLAPDGVDWFPEATEYHRTHGHRAVWDIPFTTGSEVFGYLGLAFRTTDSPSTVVTEALAALSNQVALALELTRLAEEAKQAAIAREQERAAQERAAELAKANEALKRSLDALARRPELCAFIESVLREVVIQLNASLGAYFQFCPDNYTLTLELFYNGQGLVDWQHLPEMELFKSAFDAGATAFWQELLSSRQPVAFDCTQASELSLPGTEQWHRQQGHTRVLCTLMMSGDEPLGFLGFGFKHGSTFAAQELELAQALTHQATLAIQLTRLAEEAKQEAEQTAILTERNRIAREIHDTLAQCLTGIIVQLQAAEDAQTTNPGDELIHILQATELAKAGLVEARRSVRALRPQALEDATTLDAALTQLAQRHSHNLSATCQVIGTPYFLPSHIEANLLRIAQEALTNCIRHAEASGVAIVLNYQPEQVTLQIQDDGCGFDTNQPATEGYGLIGMRERATEIGATLTLSSQPGTGTEVAIVLPLSPEG